MCFTEAILISLFGKWSLTVELYMTYALSWKNRPSQSSNPLRLQMNPLLSSSDLHADFIYINLEENRTVSVS